MASADTLSAPGAVSYSSDTMVVGDGTWDFTKNTFLLPNLVGLNFDTMQYNGMGNRFATLPQYHRLVTAHGVLAAIVFLFIVPTAVMVARFHTGRPGFGIRYHAYLQVLAVLLTTVLFTLGWFAVGPERSLTNPHHGIGVAIYTLILLQLIGGGFIRNITKPRSLRIMLHQWFGRATAMLGIVQVPLGLTLYGSPKFTFILYALWMTFLLLLYFILSYRHRGPRDGVMVDMHRSRVDHRRVSDSDRRSEHGRGWLGPLAAGAGLLALMKGRKGSKGRSRSRSRDRSRSRTVSRSRSRSRPPAAIPSRGHSRRESSYIEQEKYSDEPSSRREGGFADKLLPIAGALGAGALAKRFLDRRQQRRADEEEYSAVSPDTPSRRFRDERPARPRRDYYSESELSDERVDVGRDGRHEPLLPGPGGRTAAASALSAAEARPLRPMTPRPSHPRPEYRPEYSAHDFADYPEHSPYDSPSRRHDEEGGTGKKLLGGLAALGGLGWLGKKWKDRRDRRAEEERLRLEEEGRDGRHGSRFTGDGFVTPTRPSRRRPPRPAAETGTISTPPRDDESMRDDESSRIEARPSRTGYSGPPMPPYGVGRPPPAMAPHSRTHSRTRHDAEIEPAEMPPMPQDPHGILHPLAPPASESRHETNVSADGRPRRRESSRRRREGEIAAAAAAASAGQLAAEQEAEERRRRGHSRGPSQPVSVQVRYHDDRDRNVTLRRLTEEEAAASRRDRRRGRSDSVSSISEAERPSSRRRYRRESSARRDAEERAAERLVSEPLSPPSPAFTGPKRPKDSAYYSGQPGPSGAHAAAGQTVSSISSPHSQPTWSAMSPTPGRPGPVASTPTESPEERRRRRRIERRNTRPTGTPDWT